MALNTSQGSLRLLTAILDWGEPCAVDQIMRQQLLPQNSNNFLRKEVKEMELNFTNLKLKLPIIRTKEMEQLLNQVIDLEMRKKRLALDASHLLQKLVSIEGHEINKIKQWLRELSQ
jgi:hypothetical protein